MTKLLDEISKIVEYLNEEFNKETDTKYSPFEYKGKGRRWTRFDGAVYYDPGYIYFEYPVKTEPLIDSEKWIAWAWNKTKKFIGKYKEFQLKGEFGSSPYSDSIMFRGMFLTKNKFVITFGSKSRFKNTSIWKIKN